MRALAAATAGLWCILPGTTASLAQPAPQQVVQHYDGVLGTSLDVSLWGPEKAELEQAVAAALEEIARLEALLSTWREDSVLMQLNRNRSGTGLPPELIEVVSLCETWRERSGGIFSCRLGSFTRRWQQAQEAQQLPVVLELLKQAREINQAPLDIDAARGAITLGAGIELEPSGLAKGYIIDRAMAVLRAEAASATALKLDIGGDALYWGSPPGSEGWPVQVAGPEAVADNGAFLVELALRNRAVATSGHGSRGYRVRNLDYSHILDARRGWPVSDGAYAVATAADAVTADAVATVLAAQVFGQGTAWASQALDASVQVLVVDKTAQQWTSSGWTDLLNGDLRRQLRAEVSLTLDYTIPRLRDRVYNRPYLAVWISDSRGQSQRNLLLLGGEQRWANSNSVWWRRNGSRGFQDSYNVTRPTRGPGDYQLVWDGKDAAGNSLPEGDYVLHVEAARQNGGHDYVSLPFTLAPGSRDYQHAGQGEVGPFRFTLTVTAPE